MWHCIKNLKKKKKAKKSVPEEPSKWVFKRLKSMSFRGLRPLDPHQGPLSGPLDPMPWWASAPLASLAMLRNYFLFFLNNQMASLMYESAQVVIVSIFCLCLFLRALSAQTQISSLGTLWPMNLPSISVQDLTPLKSRSVLLLSKIWHDACFKQMSLKIQTVGRKNERSRRNSVKSPPVDDWRPF